MQLFRRLSLILVVWLTAIATLVAGAPHFVCLCPDGRVKLYCFGSTDPKTGCCGKSCSHRRDSHADQRVPATACCGHRSGSGAAAQLEKTGRLVRSGCCTKSPAQAEPAILSSADTSVVKDLAFELLLAPDVLPNHYPFAAVCRQRQERERPPPTDLIIALQHFLI